MMEIGELKISVKWQELEEWKEIERELDFLRFFYDAAGDVFGCASDDVYDLIKQEYKDNGDQLPEGY